MSKEWIAEVRFTQEGVSQVVAFYLSAASETEGMHDYINTLIEFQIPFTLSVFEE